MKSIWLPLALLAGTIATPEATAQGAGTDKAIIQAKQELEAARARLKELLSNDAAAPQVKLDKKVEWIALDDITSCEAEASCEVPAPCDSSDQVTTHAFAINGSGVAELQDITFGLDSDMGGTTEGYEVIDLGDGRTMTITIKRKSDDASDFFVSSATSVAPQMIWSSAEGQDDCSGACPTCCDSPAEDSWFDAGGPHGFFFSDEGDGGDHHAFWGDGDADTWLWLEGDKHGEHAKGHLAPTESDCCGSCDQGAHAAPQPRFPRGQQMGRMPRMGNGPQGMQGMLRGHAAPQVPMPRQQRGAWMGATPQQGHAAPQGQMRIQLQGMGQPHGQQGLFAPAPRAQVHVERRAAGAPAPQAQAWGKVFQGKDFFAGGKDQPVCEAEVTCEALAPACEVQCEVELEVCEEASACGSDCGGCGDCESACEADAPVDCEV
ncbi:MAG: hypothetical protein P1V81_00535, partial [Planctomycetota bacterium]|nr:hypothetical protein [Planctomycetota bacterium]